MKAVSVDAGCIFCKIIQGTIPSHKVFENDHVLAFLDINGLSKGHTLVIPKYHAQKTHEIPAEYMGEVGKALAVVSKAIGAENYNILQNNGREAHQAVFHVHYHIIPKLGDDGLGITWNTQTPTGDELRELAKDIRSRI